MHHLRPRVSIRSRRSDFSTFSDGGPALEASWSHPTMKKAMALEAMSPGLPIPVASCKLSLSVVLNFDGPVCSFRPPN